MVSIGNVNIGLPGSGVVNSLIATIFWSMLILVVVGLILWFVVSQFKNKNSFPVKVTLTTLQNNGTMNTRSDLHGGKFVNKSGTFDFRVKIPRTFKKKELGYMPDFSLADADGTIHFITAGDGTLWQQVERKLVASEIKEVLTDDGTVEQQQYSLLLKPIPTDIKTVTVNSIRGFKEVVNKNKLTVYAIAIGAFVIMVIAHLISLYIQTKVKCPSGP